MAEKYTPTKLDNTILKYAPGWGVRRMKNKFEAAMISGAYEPTRPGNRPYENYTQFLTSPNSRANYRERQKLVNFNRFLCYNSIGTAITNRLTDHAIGNGLTFRASIDYEFLGIKKEQAKVKNQELTRFYKSFFQAENGHFDRMYPWGYMQSIVFKSMLEGGDNFVLPVAVKQRKSHRFPFALQTFESERVTTPHGMTSNQRIIDGIEKNEAGIPVKVHVAKSMRGLSLQDSAYFSQQEWESRNIFGANTGIRQVYHIKNLAQDRPGALRGIPFLTPTIGLIIDHQESTAAVLKAAKIQSMFAAIWSGGKGGDKFGKAPGDSQTAQTTSNFPRVDLTAGQVIDMPEGYKLEGFQSTQPGRDFTPFQMQILALIGSITGIPRSFILMLFEKSFSASRGEAAIFWTTVLRNRYAFVFQFLFPFWEFLLSWGVSTGQISAPGFFDDPQIKAAWLGSPIHQFSGPRMPQLDLEKEAKGLKLLRDSGFRSTRATIESSFEDDPDETFNELAEERKNGVFQDAVAAQTQQLIAENEVDPDEIDQDEIEENE